jgi:predicted DNA-binding protein
MKRPNWRKDRTIALRITQELYEALEAEAKKAGRPLSRVARRILETALVKQVSD